MSLNTRLLESIDLVTAFSPADVNTDADGDYISLKNYDGCLVVVQKAAGTAGDDISLKLDQATAVAGTSTKALNFTTLYAKVGTQTAVSTFTKYTFTATDDLDTVSVGGTDLEADSVAALFVIDVRASDLDVSNGFDCFRLTIEGDDLGNSCLASALYIPYGARYPQATPVTAITN